MIRLSRKISERQGRPEWRTEVERWGTGNWTRIDLGIALDCRKGNGHNRDYTVCSASHYWLQFPAYRQFPFNGSSMSWWSILTFGKAREGSKVVPWGLSPGNVHHHCLFMPPAGHSCWFLSVLTFISFWFSEKNLSQMVWPLTRTTLSVYLPTNAQPFYHPT